MITALDWIRVDLGAAEIKAGRPTDPCANHVHVFGSFSRLHIW
jgi:hypothetical protein